jgi:phosphate/sulfate permease
MTIDASMFIYITGSLSVLMLIWLTIEVGRNDAANIVNAVFGARVLRRKTAVRIAALTVILGAWASSPVMETARKGIFDPSTIPVECALCIYLAVYLVDTVLLFSFSSFGMPISTTACLIFSLLGGGFALGGADTVQWSTSIKVIFAIICSIFISGALGFLIQRAFRGAIGQECEDPDKVRLHGPWIAGALLTGLVYFILMKGMKDIVLIVSLRQMTIDILGAPTVLLVVWIVLSLIIWIIIHIWKDKVSRHLFAAMAIIGMLAIAIAFGQNDLANCASPGVASWMILENGIENAHVAHEYPVRPELLLICGCLLAFGMMSKTAQRVTRSAVNTGSQGDVVRLYAPEWCVKIAKFITPRQDHEEALSPEAEYTPKHKLQHYDALRAAVITSVSASVIAFASGMGLPVSTTYVAFAAVISTGWADRIFQRGDAQLKLGRTIWVVFCWFFSAFLAAIFTGITAKTISVMGTFGIILVLIINLFVRWYFKKKSDQQEERLQQEADERRKQIVDDSSDSKKAIIDSDIDSDDD